MTTVTVILLACNEGLAFGANLVKVFEQFFVYRCYEVQYVIVDDGSADDTLTVALAFARFRTRVTVIKHGRPLGLGRALRSALEYATGEYTIVIPPRSSNAPFIAMQLLEALQREQADVAVVSLQARLSSVLHLLGFHRLLRLRVNLNCVLRGYRTSFIKELKFHAHGAGGSAELLLAALRKGARITEVSVPCGA